MKTRSDLIFAKGEELSDILTKIFISLETQGHLGQAKFIAELLALIEQKEEEQLVKLLNGVSMWGGSGAVWEVYIENNEESRKFETAIIELIDLMDATNVLGSGIRPIRKLFERNLNK